MGGGHLLTGKENVSHEGIQRKEIGFLDKINFALDHLFPFLDYQLSSLAAMSSLADARQTSGCSADKLIIAESEKLSCGKTCSSSNPFFSLYPKGIYIACV